MKKNKKAVVVGGSNGIGRSIVQNLTQEDYFVYILDVLSPAQLSDNEKKQSEYHYCDLLDFDESVFESLRNDAQIDTLIITAGMGKISAFQDVHVSHIENSFSLNTISVLKIIKIFYHRIYEQQTFHTLVMGSIAGSVSSPLFSVYAASKAAVNRFVESVNIELECNGCCNRILNVMPGAIKGTRFYGGENELPALALLTQAMLQQMRTRNVLYIPEYDAIYQDVLARYQQDPHAFGVSSYHYKINAGRPIAKDSAVIGYLSGTFDLFHIGHLNLLKRAKKHCDYLIVGVHPDASHKGKDTFISLQERKAVVGAIQYVDKVVDSFPEDCDAWETLGYNKLFVGGDYKGTDRFNRYEAFFKGKAVEIVYLPYTAQTSSTELRAAITRNNKEKL